MTSKRKVAHTVALAIFAITLLAVANFVAGMLLFASYRENPFQATAGTLLEAFLQADSRRAWLKIMGCTITAALVCLGVPFATAMAYRRRDSNLFGKARFASEEDLLKEGLLGKDKGVILGRVKDGPLLRLPGYEFVMVAAPTRSGKGVGFCIPNLLDFPDSAVVLDIKGENYNLTAQFRQKYLGNEIFYFNPFSANSHGWNVLSYVSAGPERVSELAGLAKIIYPDNPKDPFWPNSAQNLFLGITLMILETPSLPQTMGEVLRQGSGKGQEVSDYLRHIISSRKSSASPLSSVCEDALNRFLNNSENTLKSILASFNAPLAVWASPMVDKATSTNDFDLRDVRKKRMTVYLEIPAKEVTQAGFILNLFFSQLINENVRELPENNPALKYQCLMLLDEFTSMGRIPIIARGVAFMAGYNMRLAIIIQDRSQLEADNAYGKADAHNIISNMGALVVFTPSQVKEAEEYSKLIGNDTVKSYSKQHSNIGALNRGSYSASETENQQARALMLPQELLTMSKKQELVVRSGIPVIQADKIQYFSDPYFSPRFNAVEMKEVKVGGDVRKVPVPLPLPAANWRMWRSSISRSDYYMDGDFSDLADAIAETGGVEDEPTTTGQDAAMLQVLNAPEGAYSAAQIEAAAQGLAASKINEYLAALQGDTSSFSEQAKALAKEPESATV